MALDIGSVGVNVDLAFVWRYTFTSIAVWWGCSISVAEVTGVSRLSVILFA